MPFRDVLTRVDHRFRMERALLKEDYETAGRAASYAGGGYASLVRARRAVEDKSSSAASALNAVPPSLRSDPSYILSRAQYLRRADKAVEAAAILATAPTNGDVLVDGDEWWVERRIVARKLIDIGNPSLAYEVAAGHSGRTVEKRIEAEFHAGWIALRFLDDPAKATNHFAKAATIAETPISLARVAYWQGRAAEAAGEAGLAKTFYERAALQPIAYYGQLARAKLGQASLPLRVVPDLEPAAAAAFDNRLTTRALRMLEAASLKDLALPLYIDTANRLTNPAELSALGNLAVEVRNSRALVAVGKLAVQRGLPLDAHAYPTIGIPDYEASAAVPLVEKAMVFAIARQESQFDPRAQSSVGARGLMQMMPATAQRTARRVSASYDQDRLTSDPAYNARLGQAHLGELMEDWRRLLHPRLRLLQCRWRQREEVDRRLWRSAPDRRRSHRLGRAHPLHRDPQLRPARDGEFAGLPQPVGRQERAADRRRPSARGAVSGGVILSRPPHRETFPRSFCSALSARLGDGARRSGERPTPSRPDTLGDGRASLASAPVPAPTI